MIWYGYLVRYLGADTIKKDYGTYRCCIPSVILPISLPHVITLYFNKT